MWGAFTLPPHLPLHDPRMVPEAVSPGSPAMDGGEGRPASPSSMGTTLSLAPHPGPVDLGVALDPPWGWPDRGVRIGEADHPGPRREVELLLVSANVTFWAARGPDLLALEPSVALFQQARLSGDPLLDQRSYLVEGITYSGFAFPCRGAMAWCGRVFFWGGV